MVGYVQGEYGIYARADDPIVQRFPLDSAVITSHLVCRVVGYSTSAFDVPNITGLWLRPCKGGDMFRCTLDQVSKA